jgi:Cft2 family RNA processing exonuclease
MVPIECHWLLSFGECAGKRILIDCGLHQGSRELDEENAGPFSFDAAGINYVLLTHAHLDHCGRMPLLAKRGFRREIITTLASRELARGFAKADPAQNARSFFTAKKTS